jgi:riboflavin kinase / FMN adenylyltransferase
MQIIRGLGEPLNSLPTALTIGVFDGVHRGHQHLIAQVVERGRALGGQSALLSFDPHPDLVIHPERQRLYLTSLEERAELLAALGVDLLLIETFDRQLMGLSAQAFMERICATIVLRELYVGSNFALGKGREGTLPRLNEIGRSLGYQVFEVAPLLLDGAVVSSTRIREHLRAGELDAVPTLLGRPFGLRGVVVEGDKRGRTIGFPTANLALDELHLLPADGVYVCRVSVLGEPIERYQGVTNIGIRPTFAGMQRRVEAYLLDYSGDLYGRTLQLELLHRLRGEQRFSGIDELVAQITRDVAAARAFFAA